MDSNTKLFNPRFSLLFITLPQVLLAAFLTYVYQIAGMIPTLPLVIIFGIQAAFNLCIALGAAVIKSQRCRKYANMIQLVGFIVLMSAALPFLLQQWEFASALSPETIYAVLCLIPLIYTAVVILHHNEIPLMRVGVRIAICVCCPLLVAVAPVLFSQMSAHTDLFSPDNLFSGAADVILIVLFALFFILVCLMTSVLYHFRTKKAARLKENEISVQENSETTEAADGPVMADIPPIETAPKNGSVGYRIFISLFALVLPVFCLLLNNETFYKVIGDFSGVWFYILAIVNGIAMLVPRKNKWVTLVTLFFKSMGFLYVFYFTVVLLKYVPIGLAIFYFYLLPLLVLTPVILFIAELFQIIDDFKFLKQHFAVQKVTAVFACGLLFLCIGFTGNCYVQKVNFDNAMCYLNENEPEYPSVNIPMLKNALTYAGQSPRPDSFGLFEEGQGAPLLSEVYRGIVLGGKVLTADSYSSMAGIFLPENAPRRSQQFQFDSTGVMAGNVKLHDVTTETDFDQTTGLYKTWIHLQMKNESENINQEFALKFTLPDGVFISDYYLDVLGERKYGIVSEKRSAQMTYNNIVSRSRDPGIIYYEQGNAVELRVFPFNPHETRNTGFLVVYKQSETVNIGGNFIELKGEELSAPIMTGDTCFVPASYKSNLEKTIERTPKYYFIADVSKPLSYEPNHVVLDRIHARIVKYAANHDIAGADIYVTAYNTKKTDIEHFNLAEGEGGFNMALAMGMIDKDVKKSPDCYPVILVSSSDIYKAAIADNRHFLRDFPESEYYYLINDDGSSTPFRFADHNETEPTDKPLQTKVLTHEGFYFKDNDLSEVSYKNTRGFTDISYGDDLYINALLLNEKIEKAATKAQLIETVKDGFSQRILTKNNSFIVLETKEQEDELRRRNNDFLKGKWISASAPASMSEPGMIITVLFTLLLLIAVYMKRRSHRLLFQTLS